MSTQGASAGCIGDEAPRRRSRTLLIGAAAIAVALVLIAFATGMRLNLGSPPVLECGGSEPALCIDKMRDMANMMERHGWGSGPVTSFKFEPQEPGGTCGTTTIEFFVFTIGPIGWVTQIVGQPLC